MGTCERRGSKSWSQPRSMGLGGWMGLFVVCLAGRSPEEVERSRGRQFGGQKQITRKASPFPGGAHCPPGNLIAKASSFGYRCCCFGVVSLRMIELDQST